MISNYHILNGDALKDRFPGDIQGERIIIRECLIDGPVNGQNLEDLYEIRAQFISSGYEGFSIADYYEQSVSEFTKLQDIPKEAPVYLWFEDDLFCQINLWFVLHLLSETHPDHLYLVRSLPESPYSFGHLSDAQLHKAFAQSKLLVNVKEFFTLWEHYSTNNLNDLKEIAWQLRDLYPFIWAAVKAHEDRLPKDGELGKPANTLLQIMKDLNTQEFAPVFQEFCKREAIYGFGDFQVKRMINEVIKKMNNLVFLTTKSLIMNTNKANTIDTYITSFPELTQEKLNSIKAIIEKNAPKASEAMTYGMPTYKLHGNLIHFAAFKKHIGLYPTPSPIAHFKDQLKNYKTSKGAIQFPLDRPLPLDLIAAIVQFRVAEVKDKK